MTDLRYALVTPARNEEQYIGKTLESVVRQSRLPMRWVIVSDGSTDRTDEVVQGYARLHPWIELVSLPARQERNFAAKARAFNIGFQKLAHLPYDIVGNLDADLSFDQDYFAFLLAKFAEIPELGVAGTPFVEGAGEHYDYRFTNIEHVSGACQLFRNACFGDVGGYVPVKGGGIDWIAVTTARMKGWKTRTFVEKVCFHHRTMGSANGSVWHAWFRRGREDYLMGGHPLWQLVRSAYQMKSRPYGVGGLMLLCGYLDGVARGSKRPVSDELVQFHRKEQMLRLKRTVSRLLPGSGSGSGEPSRAI